MELQKQIKRIREAEKAKESEPTTTEAATEVKEKKHKKLTKEDIPRLESERELLKNLDLDALAERSLRNKLLRHKELGENELIKSLSSLSEPAKTEQNQMVLDLSARILRHKTAQEQFSKIIGFIQHILNPTNVPSTTTGGGNPKKRKNADNDDEKPKQQQKDQKEKTTSENFTGASMFVESLGGGGGDDDESDDSDSDKESVADDQKEKKEEAKSKPEQPKKKKVKSGLKWDDPDFDKYYHGEKKPNRMGQRYRRKLYEEKYGEEANHIKEAKESKTVKIIRGKRPVDASTLPKRKPTHEKSKRDEKPKRDEQPKQNMEEFHPSWQAKRQQQEMMAKALSGDAKPINKKIVFD
ncbi:BUD22-domain-containing protein [Circinella umbellata]|nr:BUD22-domain-containing protein [Circinella umbellata]